MFPSNPPSEISRPLLPIYTGKALRNVRLIGSGFIYTVGTRYFVVTAAHVATQVEGDGILFRGPGAYFGLPSGRPMFFRTAGTTHDRTDLAAQEIHPKIIDRLGEHVFPVDLSRVTMDFLIVEGMAVLFAGFPKSTNRKLARRFRARAVVLMCEQVAPSHPIYRPPLKPQTHICASFSPRHQRAVTFTPLELSRQYTAPDPDGMSGGLIYKPTQREGGVGGIIGVAIEYDAPKQVLIGIHFAGVFDLLRAHSPELSSLLPICDLETGAYRLG